MSQQKEMLKSQLKGQFNPFLTLFENFISL